MGTSRGAFSAPSPGLVRSCAARRLSFLLAAASRGGNRGPAAYGHPAPAVCTEAAEPCVVPFESASVQATHFELPEETPPEAAKGKRSVHRASSPMIEPSFRDRVSRGTCRKASRLCRQSTDAFPSDLVGRKGEGPWKEDPCGHLFGTSWFRQNRSYSWDR